MHHLSTSDLHELACSYEWSAEEAETQAERDHFRELVREIDEELATRN